MVTVFLHCWQRTEQHQENLQEQRCTTSARPALYPGPQHTSSQPSGASREVPGYVSEQSNNFLKLFWFISKIILIVLLWDGLAVNLTVTSPASSPRDTILRVEVAEIWGGCKVQKISGSRGFDLGVTREQGCPGSYTSHANLRARWFERARHTGNFEGFLRGCGVLIPLWLHQSVPWAQGQHAWMEALLSSRSSTHKIQRRRDTCTPPACCEGWPRGARIANVRVTTSDKVWN